MADYTPFITSVLPALVTGAFGFGLSSFNFNKTLKQKMIEKDLEKKEQKDVYEDKIKSLKIQHEQDIKILSLTHEQSLEKLRAEAEIKKGTDEASKIQDLTFKYFESQLNSADGSDFITKGIYDSMDDSNPLKEMFNPNLNKQRNTQKFNPNTSRSSNKSKRKR